MTNANDVIALLPGLSKEQLEDVLRKTLKAIVQLEYRELMNENEELTEKVAELEADHEKMLEAFSECQEYIDDVDSWVGEAPIAPDISDYV